MIFDKIKKQKNIYHCFYDSEFNAYDDGKNLSVPQEVVSMGLCITNDKGVMIEKFYSLISLKAAKRISYRCTEITGIKTKDLKDAEGFEKVTAKVAKLLKKYGITKVYCYGLEDKRILEKTNELYDKKHNGRYIAKLLYDVRTDLKKKTRGKVSEQGLPFLKSVCGFEGAVAHDALQDAIDLARIYYKINTTGYDEKIYEKLTKEREELISYKRNRRIKEENATVVSNELVRNKNKLVEYLEKNSIPHMDEGAKRAFIDDLNLLFIGE